MTNTEETLQPNTEALALRRKKKAKRVTYVTLIHLALIVTSLLFVFPLIWMVSVSLQSEEEMRLANGFWDMLVPNEWLWSNYPEVFKAIPFMRYFKNSAIVTSLTVLGTVVSASLVSYAFSKLRWPGRNVVYTVMLATMILPGFILMIPTYKMYSKMGFVDTWVPLILPAFLGGGAGNIILIQQFFMSIPKEMSEAAMIDGANHVAALRARACHRGDLLVPLFLERLSAAADLREQFLEADDRAGAQSVSVADKHKMGSADGGIFDLDDSESVAFRVLPKVFPGRRESGQRERLTKN